MNADKLQYDASEQSLKDVTEYIKSASGGKNVLQCKRIRHIMQLLFFFIKVVYEMNF